MLSDSDRIFTNLYGWHGADLKSAQARGDWDGITGLLGRDHEDVIETIKASGLRGRGGAGFRLGSNGHLCQKRSRCAHII